MELTVVVKGTRFEAARAAADRRIPLVFRREKDGHTVWTVPDYHEEQVQRWFCATVTPPFPPGACLFYTKRPEAETHDAG